MQAESNGGEVSHQHIVPRIILAQGSADGKRSDRSSARSLADAICPSFLFFHKLCPIVGLPK